MAFLHFNNVGVTAMAGCVPKRVIDNYHYDLDLFPEEDVRKLVDKIGIHERRFADEGTCTSDLCQAAAERLLADNDVDRNEIDLLVLATHSPDYKMPATSILLQQRLGFPVTTIAFDINLGCSGFLYGLGVVYSMMEQRGLRKALLLAGETCGSKFFSRKDRTSAFIFGDAGVAALITCDPRFGESWFSLNSDGSGSDFIMIPAGGFRHQSSMATLEEKVVDEHGNIRSDEHAYMKGGAVFNFVMNEVPKDFARLADWSGQDVQKMDYYAFHQANSLINGLLVKKLKLDPAKVPVNIHKYGNTSSASMPLVIISELKDKLQDEKRLLLSAFGTGMSWGTAIVPFVDCKISEMVEI